MILTAGQAVFQPALQFVLPLLVPEPELLPAANVLMDATDRSARLLGPGLVALLAGCCPPCISSRSTPRVFPVGDGSAADSPAAQARAPRATPSRGAQSIARGVRAMGGHRLLGYALRTTAIVNGAWYAAYFLALPLLIERRGLQDPAGPAWAPTG